MPLQGHIAIRLVFKFANLHISIFSFFQVMVCFDNKILRGNRTIKKDASSFDAFVSPNFPPLATMEIKVTGMNFTL